MPKDEFDLDDPMELNGMALLSVEDTTDAMTECFIEEFMRLGYNHQQVLALFRNRHYVGMNMVLQNRGEDYVKGVITEVFARWGKSVAWSSIVPLSSPRRSLPATVPILECVARRAEDSVALPPKAGSGVQSANHDSEKSLPVSERAADETSSTGIDREQRMALDSSASDPMGAAAPKLNL